MASLKRQKTTDVPAELQPYYDEPKPATRSWLRWVIRIVVLVVIIILLTLFIRWVWHQTHTITTPAKSPSHSAKVPPAASSAKGSSPSPATKGSTQTPPVQPPASPPVSPTTPSPSPAISPSATPLVNTGPGSTAALFATTTVAGVALYQLRLRKKPQVYKY